MRASLAQSPDIVVARRLINYEPVGVDITDAIGGKSSGSVGETCGRRRCGVGRLAHNGGGKRRMLSFWMTSMCRD